MSSQAKQTTERWGAWGSARRAGVSASESRTPLVAEQLARRSWSVGTDGRLIDVASVDLLGRSAPVPVSRVPARPEAPFWLDEVYAFVDQDDNESAIDLLFERIDDHLDAGEFGTVDGLLRTIDLSRLNITLITGVLSITTAARSALPERAAFVTRAENRLRELAPDRLERLMRGLR